MKVLLTNNCFLLYTANSFAGKLLQILGKNNFPSDIQTPFLSKRFASENIWTIIKNVAVLLTVNNFIFNYKKKSVSDHVLACTMLQIVSTPKSHTVLTIRK